jgi:hypothetical protein
MFFDEKPVGNPCSKFFSKTFLLESSLKACHSMQFFVLILNMTLILAESVFELRKMNITWKTKIFLEKIRFFGKSVPHSRKIVA